MKLKLLVIILFSFTWQSFAKLDDNLNSCLDSLQSIVAKSPIKKKTLQKYLNLQAELTLNKLSWSLLRGESTEGFKLEKKILKLLDNNKNIYSQDHEFKRVHRLFMDPHNKMSRNALNEVLPFITDILNQQAKEEDQESRSQFHLDIADVNTLAILAEKEKKNKYGKYAHFLSSNRSSDRGVLNFIKLINSSIANSNLQNKELRDKIKRKISSVQGQAKDLVLELFKDQSCIKIEDTCSEKRDNEVISQSAMNSLLFATKELSDKLTGFDKHRYLRYGDIWLHTKKSSQFQRRKRRQVARLAPVKKVSDEEIIHDYLIDHVLQYMPYYLDRETLKSDKSLTLGLAQAIDRGVLAKKGNQRVFYYKGEAYFIPELWNKSQNGSGRISKEANQKIDDFRNLLFGDDYTMPKDNGVPLKYKEDFEKTWLRTKENRDQKQAFLFKGKSYSMLTGELLPGKIKTILLNFKAPKHLNEKQVDFDKESLHLMVKEVKLGNRSYISKDGLAKHISGVFIDLDQEANRMKSFYEKSSYTVKGSRGIETFPSSSKLKAFLGANTQRKEVVKKALTDRKIATKVGAEYINLVKLKKISKGDALKVLSRYKNHHGVNPIGRVKKLESWDLNFLKENAVAVLNKRSTFSHKDKVYNTRTSRAHRKVVIPLKSSGYIPRKVVRQKRDLVNSQSDDLLKLKLFHKNYDQKCKEYTVVDKSAPSIAVYNNSGNVLFKKEILLGKKMGDERTRYYNFKTRRTNNETGAGIYNIGDQMNEALNFNGNALDLSTQKRNSALSISQIANSTPERFTLLNDNNPRNNRVTNGGIMLHPQDMKLYIKKFAKKDCPFYVLPETDLADFVVKDNQLSFLPNCRKCDNKLNIRKPNIQVKPIVAKITVSKYKNSMTDRFIQTLVDEKKDLMPLLGITNDDYNDLVGIAFGVLGAESKFGEHWAYKFKETKPGQKSVKLWKGDKKSWGFLGIKALMPLLPVALVEDLTIKGDDSNNSRGPTQIKNISYYLKGKYKNIIRTNNLSDPKNSAIATMFVLANKLKSLKRIEKKHSAINEVNRLDYLYYLYMGSTDQILGNSATPLLNPKVSAVNQFSRAIEIDESL